MNGSKLLSDNLPRSSRGKGINACRESTINSAFEMLLDDEKANIFAGPSRNESGGKVASDETT